MYVCMYVCMYITNQFEGGNSEAPNASNGKPNPNPPRSNLKAPLRSATPSQRPTISSIQSTKTTKVTPIINQQLATNISSNTQTNATTATTTPSKFTNQREIHNNNPVQQNPKPNPKPRKQSCSPSVTRGPKAEFKQENIESKFYTLFHFLFIMSVKFE
ncbi:hypothetical protein ACB098_06G008900 [Castanea mollissima]